MKVETYTAPSHWASYFINADATGFDYSNTADDPNAGDREMAAADAFLERIGHGSPVSCEDAGFLWHHDAWHECPYGADCQEYAFLIEED